MYTMPNNLLYCFNCQKILTIALNIAKLLVFILIKRVRVIHNNKKYNIHIKFGHSTTLNNKGYKAHKEMGHVS